MTSKYYVHAKYREFKQPFRDLTFIIIYNDKITTDLIDDFKYVCRDFIKKQCKNLVEFELINWVKIDE